jgi:trans-aconitate 2-methyltransferase
VARYLYTVRVADWDAALYHQVAAPQFEWGVRLVDRLVPRRGERILDVGCGTGRVTAEILRRTHDGLVIGLDRSGAMIGTAVAERPEVTEGRLFFVRGDGAALPFVEAFDAVFSAATLHWIANHAAAFVSIFDSLRPGGRFVAQCGGGPNLQRIRGDARLLMASERYRPFFGDWADPWTFTDAESSAALLAAAGFEAVETWLEEAPTHMPGPEAYSRFIRTVCVRHHIDRLPEAMRAEFARDLTVRAADYDPPYMLDYWRLNISARRPAAGARA